jgi:hypothetical protein
MRNFGVVFVAVLGLVGCGGDEDEPGEDCVVESSGCSVSSDCCEGLQCIGVTCLPAASSDCETKNCTGGCCDPSTGECATSQSPETCGKEGGLCQDCTTTEEPFCNTSTGACTGG